MQDGWTMPDSPEHAMVESRSLAEVQRAASAITTISMLLRNSLGEPEGTGTGPLGRDAHYGLLDALQIIGKYLHEVGEQMSEISGLFRECERPRAAPAPKSDQAA
ncbi:hypothetical protein CY652_10615 [Burkholderia sp. WAC0059]|nr:hypothetical protein CY652_10615 [Burkholderia sp. WAC0059]